MPLPGKYKKGLTLVATAICLVTSCILYLTGEKLSLNHNIWMSGSQHNNDINLYQNINQTVTIQPNTVHNGQRANNSNTTYLIYCWNPYSDRSKYRPYLRKTTFDVCEFSNCGLTFDGIHAEKSDAVIFYGRHVEKDVGFKRPRGQIWIFQAHEPPISYMRYYNWRTEEHLRTQYNWTMTYNKDDTDIYTPYGEIRKHPDTPYGELRKPVVRDYIGIARNKTKDAVIVTSHCATHSMREKFIDQLKNVSGLDIDILGRCGKPWHCGTYKQHNHECFQRLLNTTYKFYLAFENAFCHQYFTEKFYGNYNYDIILVTLGGSKGEASTLFPDGTFVASDAFPTISALGDYLKTLASDTDAYAEVLKRKSEYYSVNIEVIIQRSMCEICKRMNNLEKYRKQIPDIQKWAFNSTPCRKETFKV